MKRKKENKSQTYWLLFDVFLHLFKQLMISTWIQKDIGARLDSNLRPVTWQSNCRTH